MVYFKKIIIYSTSTFPLFKRKPKKRNPQPQNRGENQPASVVQETEENSHTASIEGIVEWLGLE